MDPPENPHNPDTSGRHKQNEEQDDGHRWAFCSEPKGSPEGELGALFPVCCGSFGGANQPKTVDPRCGNDVPVLGGHDVLAIGKVKGRVQHRPLRVLVAPHPGGIESGEGMFASQQFAGSLTLDTFESAAQQHYRPFHLHNVVS